MTQGTSLTGPALVTGGARGIGYTLASALAAKGAPVVLLDILPEVEASAARLAEEHGVDALGLRVDVTNQAEVADAFAEAAAKLGTPRTLVTAAGITVWGDSVDVTAEDWRRVMSVNLDGTFFALQAFGKGLLEAELTGSAVLVASMSASIVNVPQFQASYNASKAAVAHLGKSLAVEWAPAGIRVNSISPGYILSDMTRVFTEKNPDLAADWASRIPLGRMGVPDDLTGLVTFLASDEARYLTGQDVIIDGGYTAL